MADNNFYFARAGFQYSVDKNLSVAAGYGGKVLLDAFGERIKAAVARAETAKTKEDATKAVATGKEAADVAKKAVSLAQQHAGAKKQAVEILKTTKGQPVEVVLGILEHPSSTGLQTFVSESPEALEDDLKRLCGKLDAFGDLFSK